MIAYDLQGAQSVHHAERGIARYVVELALALERIRPGFVDRFVVNPDLPRPPALEPFQATGRLRRCDIDELTDTTIFHVASPMENGISSARLIPGSVRNAGARLVATVYDLIPLIFPEHYLRGLQNRAEYTRGLATLWAVDELLAISQATAEDVHRLLGIRRSSITVIGAGAGDQFRRPTAAEAVHLHSELARAIPDIAAGFLLVPTGIDHRKNVERTVEAYARLDESLRQRHQLVIACRVDDATRARIEDQAAQLGVLEGLVLTGFVSDQTLVRLYQAAELVVIPSLYEGFGLPALEARACGAPVVCSGTSSLPEVIVDSRAHFDPENVVDIARCVGSVLTKDHLRAELATAPLPPFTWDLAAERTIAVYERLLRRIT